ncbi:MAG TPA: hypothetical protein VEB22_05075 [Phycisphaerales bacterium]|nr:hypothetical protein [Phycisphaerales bacterium]
MCVLFGTWFVEHPHPIENVEHQMKKFLLTVAVAGLAFGTLAACEEKKPAAAVKDAVKDVKDAAKEGAADVKDAVKDATK